MKFVYLNQYQKNSIIPSKLYLPISLPKKLFNHSLIFYHFGAILSYLIYQIKIALF